MKGTRKNVCVDNKARVEEVEKILMEFPTASNAALGRMLFDRFPSLFSNAEYARNIVRYHIGSFGDANRKKSIMLKQGDVVKKTLEIPKSWGKKRAFYKIPKIYNKVGIISDMQAPFHDEDACEIALNYLVNAGINALFINGDAIDFYHLSFFQKDARQRNFKKELSVCRNLLAWIRGKVGDIPIFYNLDANHENRYERYMKEKAPELLSTEEFMIEDLLKLRDFNITPIRGFDHVKIGKLPIVHGHTVFRGTQSPASPARTVYMKMKKSCLASHCHQDSKYTITDMDGKVISCYTIGCLMNIECVEYNQHGHNYMHGFAIVETQENGNYSVQTKMIINGQVH